MVMIEKTLRTCRQIGTFWVAERTQSHLREIRERELAMVVRLFPPGSRILEIGGGSGWQAKRLSDLGYDVTSIDIVTSVYLHDRVFDVQVYDGKAVPFGDSSFDAVFSSNALEHIELIEPYQHELLRVVKRNGRAVHLIPSSSWRAWTIVTDILRSWRPVKPHGEHAANVLSEIAYFRRGWWAERFEHCGWKVERIFSNDLFYTGSSVLDRRLSLELRHKLSRILGGSCNIYVLRK